MSLETATYINGLVSTNPTATDNKSEGDDHIRLLKSTIQATFPSITGAVTATHTELNYVDGVTSAIQTQLDAKAPAASPTFTGTVTLPSTTTVNGFTAGYRAVPLNNQTTNYTLVAADAGKAVVQSSSHNTTTVPSGIFSAGDKVTIVNNIGTTSTVVQGSGLSMRLAGTASTGDRTLAANSVVEVWFIDTTTAYIRGDGIS